VLILESDSHPQPFCFVGELEAHGTVRPLVNLLVIGMSNIVVLSQITHIADNHGLHALFIQRGDQSRGLLVLDVFDLAFDLLQLPFLGVDEPLPPLAAFFHPAIDAAIQVSQELIAILDLGAQEPPIEDVGVFSIVRRCHMDLAKIDSCDFLALW